MRHKQGKPYKFAEGGGTMVEGGATAGPNPNIDDATRERARAAVMQRIAAQQAAQAQAAQQGAPAAPAQRPPPRPAPQAAPPQGPPAPRPTRATGMGPMPMTDREAQAASAPQASYSNEGRPPTRANARQIEGANRAAMARRIAAEQARAEQGAFEQAGGGGTGRTRATGMGPMPMAKGGCVKQYAGGGSVDGCATRGKTRAKMR